MQKSNFKKKLIIFKAFLILFMISSSSTAQIEFGIKGGLNFNSGLNETYLIEALQSQGKPDGDFNIFDKKSLSARSLSAGNAQFISFVRSIVDDPNILILDEPCSNLDEIHRKKVELYLKRNKKKSCDNFVRS